MERETTKAVATLNRQSMHYADNVATSLRRELKHVEYDITRERKHDAEIRVLIHLIFLTIGLTLSVAFIGTEASPYMAVGITSVPSFFNEVIGYIRKV